MPSVAWLYPPGSTCSFDGCDLRPRSKGLCNTHYHRFLKHGDPTVVLKVATGRKGQPCDIEGCDKPIRYRDWCNAHYTQWQRTGNPLALKNPHRPAEERFWMKVDKDGPGGCWLWTGALTNGYGAFEGPAHRFAYELLVGPIPAGLHIDHVYDRGCRHKNCVNPAHLEAVTQGENTRRMMKVRAMLKTEKS